MFAQKNRSIRDLAAGLVLAILFVPALGTADESGVLRGRICDAETKNPIPAALIVLEGLSLSAVTNDEGAFEISGIPAGSCAVTITARGFKPHKIPTLLILAGRILVQNIEMVKTRYDAEEKISVEAGYFEKKAVEPVSQFRLGRTEIERTPGTIEDLSRVLALFPSIARVNELFDDLIVRGGSPFENGFYLDGVPISNINYFQRDGGSGGAIGILDTGLIENVDFSAGGFSAVYGDRLSSIIDISLRPGRTDRIAAEANLNVTGLGLTVEGPLPRGKGSWVVSGKRSYYDLVAKVLDVGIVPNMGTIQAKIDYQPTSRDRITVLDVFGTCRLSYGLELALKEETNYATNASSRQNTLGIVWNHLWGEIGYSKTTLSGSTVTNLDTLDDPFLKRQYLGRDETETVFTLRNVNVLRFNSRNQTEFGFEARAVRASFNNYFAPYVDKWGLEFPGLQIDGRFRESLSGVFASHRFGLSEKLSLVFGLRGDYFTFNRRTRLSPRASLSWKAGPRLTFNIGGGIYRQTLYPLLLVRNPQSASLQDPQATHLIAGMDLRLGDNAEMTVEVYDKSYRHMPLTPDDPTLFILDNNVAMTGYFQYDRLTDQGLASSRGVELFLQKKFGERVSVLVSASLFRSRFRDDNGIWRDRLYDNRALLTLIGRWQPDDRWEFNVRWNYAGGIPYTPLDLEKSRTANMGILDRSRFLGLRYPDYHSLCLRADRRFVFKKSVLSAYLSLINAYDQKNIARYYWNRAQRAVSTVYQARLIPVFGIEMEF